MDVNTIKHYIQTKDIPSFLIFSGSEWAVQRIYINKIAEVLTLDIKYVDSITDIYGILQSRQMFTKNSLYVIRDDREIINNEKIQDQLNNGLLKNNCLILLLNSLDKRTKFYKAYKDTICEFEALKPQILKKYIQKEITLSNNNCDKLIEACENDYGHCLLEIDKIKQYGAGMKLADYDMVFQQLLTDGTIYTPPKDAIFDFVDAILDRDPSCFDLYEQCKAVGEAVMVMLTVLYNNTKAVLQIQSCETTKDLSKTTGLTQWQINNALRHKGKYRIGELVGILRLVRECEKGIKTGRYEEQFVMDYILVNTL